MVNQLNSWLVNGWSERSVRTVGQMVGQNSRSNGQSERSVKRSVRTVGQTVGQNGRSGGRSERSVKRSVRTFDRPISVMVMTGHDRL